MRHLINIYNNHKDFVGYFVAAFTGVIVQYIVGTTILINYFDQDPGLSYAIGFIVSFPVGFFLTKLLAFDARKSGKTQREFIKYLLTVVISGFITVYGSLYSVKLLLYLLGDSTVKIPFINYSFTPAGTIGHFMGMGMSFVFNFIAHKYFTFHTTGLYDKMKGHII